jgi:hypothetical protein
MDFVGRTCGPWRLGESPPVYRALKRSSYIKLSATMMWTTMIKFLSGSCKTNLASLRRGTCKHDFSATNFFRHSMCMFSMIDRNNDGFVTFMELLKFMFASHLAAVAVLRLTIFACTRTLLHRVCNKSTSNTFRTSLLRWQPKGTSTPKYWTR